MVGSYVLLLDRCRGRFPENICTGSALSKRGICTNFENKELGDPAMTDLLLYVLGDTCSYDITTFSISIQSLDSYQHD